jgi:ACT domain-containing protein
MTTNKIVGRPPKVNYKTIIKLADSIQHNATITDACDYAGISRDTYYRYMNKKVFAEKMNTAKENQTKAVFSFLTTF